MKQECALLSLTQKTDGTINIKNSVIEVYDTPKFGELFGGSYHAYMYCLKGQEKEYTPVLLSKYKARLEQEISKLQHILANFIKE